MSFLDMQRALKFPQTSKESGSVEPDWRRKFLVGVVTRIKIPIVIDPIARDGKRKGEKDLAMLRARVKNDARG